MKIIHTISAVILLRLMSAAHAQMLVTITDDVQTDFGLYHPISVQFTPSVPAAAVEADFSNVYNFDQFQHEFNETQLNLLRQNHFVAKPGRYSQLYDTYNEASYDAAPVFITSDAVLHIYHVLYDKFLAEIEQNVFFGRLTDLTQSMIEKMQSLYEESTDPLVKESSRCNLAFAYVAKKLLYPEFQSVHDSVRALVDAELVLITEHDGFHISPIFGSFSALDYSQFQVRGHYTKNDTLSHFFRAMMWYGWTIFTMEKQLFGGLSERHTLQALLLTQSLYKNETDEDNWSTIYKPTRFFVGEADDPLAADYLEIAVRVYGSDFLNLSAETLAELTLISAFMEDAQELPEPEIPNWIYGTYVTYKGFRYMGQRYIPDSHMFAELIDPFVTERFMPMGLDIMAILGSDRAFEIADTFYNQTQYGNYTQKISEFNQTFSDKTPAEWAQNLYWNWLYCLMPLLYEKGEGFPYFMQTAAWADKELMTALASWAELRHDTILYAKQSMSPCCMPPGPPRSYVEPNPFLYARLQSLVDFTISGLESFGLLTDAMREKLDLFGTLLDFLKKISVKELQNEPIGEEEYSNMFCFGKVMEELVSETEDPQTPWESASDDMAVIADVHTDSNTDMCLEEGVGYPLDIFVIVNEGGILRMTRGAIFSYYEFMQPIAQRLTDERWREMLAEFTEPDLPGWTASFMDPGQKRSELQSDSPENIYENDFTGIQAEVDPVPRAFDLEQNYPNPFNPVTMIRFRLSGQGRVRLVVYDLSGREVAVVADRVFQAGTHAVDFDGAALPSGMYVYAIETGSSVLSRKMLLIR